MKAKDYFEMFFKELTPESTYEDVIKQSGLCLKEFYKETATEINKINVVATRARKINELNKKWLALTVLVERRLNINADYKRSVTDVNPLFDSSDMVIFKEGFKTFITLLEPDLASHIGVLNSINAHNSRYFSIIS